MSDLNTPWISTTLASAAQRARLLVNGVAGPLSVRQRALAEDILRDIEHVHERVAAECRPVAPEPETFRLGDLVRDACNTVQFIAHRKRLTLDPMGLAAGDCVADFGIVQAYLKEALKAAANAAVEGSRIYVEVARCSDRLVVDISAPDWDPRLPPSPAAGSGVACLLLTTASGRRLLISVPAQDVQATAAEG